MKPTDQAPPEELKQKPVVFFVDDEAGIRRIANRLLKKRGFDMIAAGTAAEAFDVIDRFEGTIDVLLMDMNLPDGWGGRVAQRLKTSRPEMAVVYTTGLTEIDPEESGGLSGADFVIRKPFTGDQLADAVTRAMAARSVGS